MSNFEMSMRVFSTDESTGEVTESFEMVPHRATFEDGILEIFRTIGDTEHKMVHQPWKFVDGVRTAWDNIDEGIAWYKAGTEEIGE